MKSRLLFPFHISYGVILIDLDDALFNVNASISQTYPQNDSQDIINLSMSNKIRLHLSETPFRWSVLGGLQKIQNYADKQWSTRSMKFSKQNNRKNIKHFD
jgi:hypothetical protein